MISLLLLLVFKLGLMIIDVFEYEVVYARDICYMVEGFVTYWVFIIRISEEVKR